MSGYGRGSSETEDPRVTVELRSVNHRFLDLSFKLPRVWLALESKLSAALRAELGRGRVEVFARRELLGNSGSEARVDVALARSIHQAAGVLAEELRIDGSLGVRELLGMSGVVTTHDVAVDVGSEGPVVLEALGSAIAALKTMRASEGASLREDLVGRFETVTAQVDAIEAEASAVPEQVLARIRRRVDELLGQLEVDPDRLAQEAALLADKAGIDEEVTRLRSHVGQARELLDLDLDEPIGRRLDFLVQELNRETNTIGSKSASTLISSTVVDLKSEIERIREQVANLE